jgi:hypothetical protein
VIRERSVAGSHRVAESGGWLGGSAPFGYRKDNNSGKVRLALSEEPIGPIGMSEAEAVPYHLPHGGGGKAILPAHRRLPEWFGRALRA